LIRKKCRKKNEILLRYRQRERRQVRCGIQLRQLLPSRSRGKKHLNFASGKRPHLLSVAANRHFLTQDWPAKAKPVGEFDGNIRLAAGEVRRQAGHLLEPQSHGQCPVRIRGGLGKDADERHEHAAQQIIAILLRMGGSHQQDAEENAADESGGMTSGESTKARRIFTDSLCGGTRSSLSRQVRMAAMLFPTTFLASGGIVFAFENSTLPGRLILLALFIASIFSWAVMITKFRVVRHAKLRSRAVPRTLFARIAKPLRIFTERAKFEGATVFAFTGRGARNSHSNFSVRLTWMKLFAPGSRALQKSPRRRCEWLSTSMERAVGETALRLESQMILLATAVSGAPFLGLLGTVWGVMETFGDVAAAGSANLAAMAPGVSAALITTVTGLLVAIPAMFGYNYLVTTIRAMIVELDNFAAELASEFEHKYVDHGERGRTWR